MAGSVAFECCAVTVKAMTTFLIALTVLLAVYGALMTYCAYKWRSLSFRWRKQALDCLVTLLRAQSFLESVLSRADPGERLAAEAEEFLRTGSTE